MNIALSIVFTVLASAVLTLGCGKILQILQLSSYRATEVFAWAKHKVSDLLTRYFSFAFFSFLPMMMFWICFRNYPYYISRLGFLIFFVIGGLFIYFTYKQFKVPLKITARIKRIFCLLFLLFCLSSFPLIYFCDYFGIFGYSPIAWLALLSPLFALVAHFISLPIEHLIERKFLKKATLKLNSMPELIKIGITGSYGKTTTKNILAEMLSANYRVCKSPASYNTLMGLCRTVNEVLKDDDEIFIAEMGARHRGDIKELSEFIEPRYGLITAIGDMHLQTFGSEENIAATKYELIESLPRDGVAVFNGEDKYGEVFYNKTACNKLITCSEFGEISAFYKDVSYGADGTEFVLVLDGKQLTIKTKLLGKHIPSLITLCALLSYKLGVSVEKIVDACNNLEQIPHRLQIIKNNAFTIIDDSFNSNPKGAENAVELLQYFEGTKILITPGMVELGQNQMEYNKKFGEIAAKYCDLIIGVSINATDIETGAMAAGMNRDSIIKCNTLDEATDIIKNLPIGKYVILYENDLPDNY